MVVPAWSSTKCEDDCGVVECTPIEGECCARGQYGESSQRGKAQPLRKLKVIHLAPVLAIIALFAWAFASPMGAAPDDDFHLVSTWCAVVDGTTCSPGVSANSRLVPEAILNSACYEGVPTESAACQRNFSSSSTPDVLTKRGNFVGAYPPVYYTVMHLFVGDDILTSVVIMRLVNVLLFVGLTTALFWLLPIPRRQTLLLAWMITTIPMGMFLIASNNPSGWAVVGVGTSWLALLGYMESRGRRKWGLGVIALAATIMAAGSRSDAAIYAVLGIGAVFVLTFPRARAKWRSYALDAILPIALVGICIAFVAVSGQTQSGINGFGSQPATGPGAPSPVVTPQSLTGFGRFAYNLLNIPFLWAGNFGQSGLGWMDTSLPSIVTFGTISCLVAVGFVGLSRLWGRKLFVVLGAGFALCAVPLFVLTRGGQIVGEVVQPRYVLPLIVLLAGLILLTQGSGRLTLTRAQSVLIIATLSVANMVAMHMNIRRYVTGVDGGGVNLDAGVEWWWNIAISPMGVWIIGSLAFAGAISIMVYEVAWPKRNTIPNPNPIPKLTIREG
ncbi:MAG: DUF2142 domain-containing protein [Terrimesophilobacter sp.]